MQNEPEENLENESSQRLVEPEEEPEENRENECSRRPDASEEESLAVRRIKVRKKRSGIAKGFFGFFRLVFRLISVVLALFLGSMAIFLAAVIYINAPPDRAPSPRENNMQLDDDGALRMEIRGGETAYSVGTRLEKAGVIRSRYLWYLLFRLDSEYVKTGIYRLELPASQIKIRSTLINGEQLLARVTIPEGVTLKKTARILEEAGICDAEEFLAAASSRDILDEYGVPGPSMEGYLYPDTYLFPLAYPAPMVARAMADNFFRRLREIAPEYADPPVELNNRIIIASIVEREYRVPEEAALMAGVFYNRIRINMALQSCATVEYVITEILGRPHPEVLYNRDLEINDRYNTYMYAGLPPGPISAPGETALRAAFEPAESDYLYFRLTDAGAGSHYFSRTLDDHIRAGALYVKGR